MREFKPLYTRLVLDRHKLSVHANDPKLSERARFTAAHMCTVLTDTLALLRTYAFGGYTTNPAAASRYIARRLRDLEAQVYRESFTTNDSWRVRALRGQAALYASLRKQLPGG